MSCTIPSSKSNIKELTYIECKLDILKFPLINPTSINLPSQLPLKDINIINWDKMIKVHDCSKCNPKYSLKFSPKEYIETSCYKPHYNKISVKGQIAQKGNGYSFEMNAFVDGQITLLPCELKSLGENSNDYQLDCITNGKNSVSIYNTFARDVYSKELIYIQGSHTFTIKECIPTKFIIFKTIETECSIADKLFKIFFYADIKGFSNEVKITVYLEKPTYAYMTCTIPKTGGSDQYIYCTIDVNRYPLKSMNEITLPSEFYIHPECEINDWEKISKKISTTKCSATHQYTFNAKKYLNTECYLNGYNSFAIEGIFETDNNSNINNLKVRKIQFENYVNSGYNIISCEIYPPDVSNVYSRLYCYSPEKKSVQIFPTIAEDENSKEKIFINIDHTFDIKNCAEQNKMIYFKGVESECSLNESILKILIYADMIGFNNGEKITINLKYPSASYLECSNTNEYIECALDISKFPLVSKDTIKMPDTFPQISNCYISNWININKEISTGKCHYDYSLVFSSSKSYEAKCYDQITILLL